MNKAKTLDILSLVAIAAMIILSFYFYKVLPDQVISHWNANGQPDDYSSKTFLVIFMPLLAIGMYLLFKFLPKIDPKKVNYENFASAYSFLKFFIILFVVVIYFISGAMNLDLGRNWEINKIMPVIMAALFVSMGFLMPKIKSNWFAGIRTPWTLSSEDIWDKTHKLAGKVFVLMGLVFLSMLWLPGSNFWYVIIIVLVLVFVPVVYSYILYKNKPISDNNKPKIED